MMQDSNRLLVYRESVTSILACRLKLCLFGAATRSATDVYIRGGDIISTLPLINGTYEPEVMALISHFAECGFSECLIDIGANVGLTSYYASDHFRQVHCFEPNPKVFHVLCANLYEKLDAKVFAHNFAIGSEDSTAVLNVPPRNFGGAFVDDQHNFYDKQELAAKDGFALWDDANYQKREIVIRRGREALCELVFGQELSSCVIKIDVEGYESVVLSEVAAALPRKCRAAIIFENWSLHFDIRAHLEAFDRPGKAYRVCSNTQQISNRLQRAVYLLAAGRKWWLSEDLSEQTGTIVFVFS